jgi:hypothetical protein
MTRAFVHAWCLLGLFLGLVFHGLLFVRLF